MSARIDITEAEADTKIRGKYLRALENEEWRLLPGPTFVRSFLRTYADYLGLDGRLLVEDFKLRHEAGQPEHQPIASQSQRDRDRRKRPTRTAASAARIRGVTVVALLIALLGGLFALGRDSSDDKSPTPAVVPDGPAVRPSAGPGVATLVIEPTVAVLACVRAADGTVLADGVLQPGSPGRELRSRILRLTLSNASARLVVNGKRRPLPATDGALGYEVTVEGLRRLPARERPRCSS